MFRIIKLGTTEKLIIAITTSQFSTGAKYTASSITATFYKVNAGGDALEIDTAIGTSGVVTLSADTGSKTGFHTALLAVSALTAKVYCVVFEATIDGVAAISHEFLDISAERKKIADYIDAAVSGLSTFNPSSDEVDIGSVKGTGVTGIDDFKADVSGLLLADDERLPESGVIATTADFDEIKGEGWESYTLQEIGSSQEGMQADIQRIEEADTKHSFAVKAGSLFIFPLRIMKGNNEWMEETPITYAQAYAITPTTAYTLTLGVDFSLTRIMYTTGHYAYAFKLLVDTNGLFSESMIGNIIKILLTQAGSTSIVPIMMNIKVDVDTPDISGIEAVTDKLDTMLELDGDVSRFTENALEEAPVPDVSGLATQSSVDTLSTNLLRGLGLMMENHVEDDIVRNAQGLKTSSKFYLYDSSAHATTHDKVTGVIAAYTVSVSYDGSGRVTLFKVVKD